MFAMALKWWAGNGSSRKRTKMYSFAKIKLLLSDLSEFSALEVHVSSAGLFTW